MVLQEVQVVVELFQVELKEQELLVKEILEEMVEHLHLTMQLEVVEVLVEQVIQVVYRVVLQEEQVVQVYQVILQVVLLKEQVVVEMELKEDL